MRRPPPDLIYTLLDKTSACGARVAYFVVGLTYNSFTESAFKTTNSVWTAFL